MSRTKRFQVKHKQKEKRRKRRLKLTAQKVNPDEHFFSGYYVGPKK